MAASPRPAAWRRWYVLGVLMVVYALNQADRFVMSSLLEPIKHSLHLSDAAVGLLSGVALALFYVVAGLPIAALADRYSRRDIIAASLALWSGFTALCGVTQNYAQLLAVRVGVGVGEAGGTAPSHALLSDLFPPVQRPRALAIFGIGVSLGLAVSSWGGWLSEHIGWRPVFFVFGVPGIVLALLIRMSVPEPARSGSHREVSAPAVGLGATFRYILSETSLRHQMWAAFACCLSSWGLIWWLPAYLTRSHGLSVGEAGAQLGWMHGIGGTSGLIASVGLMRWFERMDPRWPARAAALLVSMATVPAIIAVVAHSYALTHEMLWLFITVIYALYGPMFALMQNTAPAAMRSQVAAIGLLVINVANLVIAPLGVGWASDLLASRFGTESLRMALIPLSALGFWAAVHYWACADDLPNAMRRSKPQSE